jgi:hypothetical protein
MCLANPMPPATVDYAKLCKTVHVLARPRLPHPAARLRTADVPNVSLVPKCLAFHETFVILLRDAIPIFTAVAPAPNPIV